VGIDVSSGPWDSGQIAEFLDATIIPVRLASSGRRGPIVQSLWYLHLDGALWCCTQRTSLLARRLRRDPAVGFEVSGDLPPYRGVRGRGRAELRDDSSAELLPKLITRYLGPGGPSTPLGTWLLGRIEHETAIRIAEITATSWDYSSRMGSSSV
jgi:hypothetical protein